MFMGWKINIKMSILSKVIYRFNTSLSMYQWIFHRNTKKEFIWNHKRSQIATSILKNNNKTGGITLSDFKIYYKAIAIKIV